MKYLLPSGSPIGLSHVQTERLQSLSELGGNAMNGSHDGSRIVLRKCEDGYDPTNRSAAQVYIQERMKDGEYLTGLLFVEPSQNEFHALNGTPDEPLNSIPYEKLSPGVKGLEKILARYR